MELSLAGLIGALVGLMIGVIDFGFVAMLLRRAFEKGTGSTGVIRRAETLETVLKVAFVVNALVFAGLGYWFGATMGG
ncbi:hypothetical protein [Pinisolibacter sp.]|uniref:hypothetical protein n=1 Tax=Pinisolibacter sp. TaxID=2172024 RepID=UPI002FDE2BEA